MDLVELHSGAISASIGPDGQLVSIKRNGIEYMHGAGKPAELRDPEDNLGWKNSELNMFPVIGKTNNGSVTMNGRKYAMDQHGISRAIPFSVTEYFLGSDRQPPFAEITQSHHGDPIKNPRKNPDGSSPENLEWPRYSLTKSMSVSDDYVEVRFSILNSSNGSMGYQFGWHPAFRIQSDKEDGVIEARDNDAKISRRTLTDVIDASSALYLPNTADVTYRNERTGRGARLLFDGFKHAMLWTPSADAGMFCIEPVTQLPDAARNYIDGSEHESLSAGQNKRYQVHILPF